MARKALDGRAELTETRGSFGARLANDRGDLARERRGERRHRTDRSRRTPLRDQRLRADEDVEAGQEVLRETLPGRIGHLEPGDVRRVLLQPFEHGRRNGIAGGAANS